MSNIYQEIERLRKKENKPLIMTWDIETSPCLGLFWRPSYNATITYDQILDEGKIICISFKLLGSKYVYNLVWDTKKQCDKDLLVEFADIYSQMDAVVTHNGDKFDIKWIKTRLLNHKLPALKPVVSIDTLKLAKQLGFNSNRLDYINKFLGKSGKKDGGGWSRVKKILRGDREALEEHRDYCDRDVVALEEIFKELIPYVNLPTHLGVLNGSTKGSCPKCGSTNSRLHGNRVTAAGIRYEYRQCRSCANFYNGPRVQ